jgi:hypothetical protein
MVLDGNRLGKANWEEGSSMGYIFATLLLSALLV